MASANISNVPVMPVTTATFSANSLVGDGLVMATSRKHSATNIKMIPTAITCTP